MPSCITCKNGFEISPYEQSFHRKISVPSPQECPNCRSQRRVAFRNEQKFYKRACGFSKKNIICLYSPLKPHKVYEVEEWFSDKWDPLEYARDFNFSRPFFVQFEELSLAVPKPSLTQVKNENCPYTTGTAYSKNCHLINSSEYAEDCYYGKLYQNAKNGIDSVYVYDSELIYECFNVRNCYQCTYLANSQNCSDCSFGDSLNNCKNCFLCTNLNHKEYHFMNLPCSHEEYEQKIKAFRNFSGVQKAKEILVAVCREKIVKYANITNAENCSGDFIRNSRNCIECFDVLDSEDCAFVQVGVNTKDLLDCSNMYLNAQSCYQTMSTLQPYNVHFSLHIYYGHDILYSEHCYNSEYLFGCSGLRNKKYCIFNRQYSPEEYFIQAKKIVDHMRSTGEWGEFFPMSFSPFDYNETVAAEYFPLSRNEVLAKGWRWKEEETREYFPQTYEIPEEISDVSENILSEILACRDCGKNYRIIEPELGFYRKMQIPIPHKCPDCRYTERMNLRNPRMLWPRECQKCGIGIQSTYAPTRPEIVYCEKCYLREVF